MYIILVSDAHTRKAFDIISIISTAFPEIPIICGDIIGSKSSKRHLRRLFHLTTERLRIDKEEVFNQDLLDITTNFRDVSIVFIPVEEITIKLFYQFQHCYGRQNLIAILPDENTFDTVRDKRKLNEFCLNNGLNAPFLYSIQQLPLLDNQSFPLLLKPCIGSGAEGIIRLYNKNDLTNDVINTLESRDYLIQELVGNGHDVVGAFFLYSKEGRCVGAYSHQRIRTSPPGGGVTVLSKMTYNKDVIEEGKKILEAIGWRGLIMLEFLYDNKTNTYKVIEANPRVWGSVMLSEYGGGFLLTNYVRLCMNEKPKTAQIDTNKYIRWLFPVDILNYIKSLGRIPDFWNFESTCFINWSYSKKWTAIKFNFFNLFSIRNLKRFLRR